MNYSNIIYHSITLLIQILPSIITPDSLIFLFVKAKSGYKVDNKTSSR